MFPAACWNAQPKNRPPFDRRQNPDTETVDDQTIDSDYLLGNLARLPDVLRALVGGLDSERARHRPADGGWSILEVLGHLVDEEREDFFPRLSATLEDPSRPWAPIDPEARVKERDWNSNTGLDELLWILTTERATALARLRMVPRPDWSRTHAHPSLGPLTAADLLLSWVAHDQLHLRQILGLLRGLAQASAPGSSAQYAG